ncbi:MAG: aminotransferase class III-fold pyridoxal phosphate-dependent enzyme [Phycisphaeraceae bacterium]|nr:aminotransferase class III-fold pyridoxal phosphate-dependent enzyme [Phycisphaeraceae bacterium]MCW5755124.1 aminotransferase class III-fold pyridoxal phosphate-dependent enzyme [Phycisphaeraceae bacterium]
MSTITETAQTVGQSLKHSPAIRAAVDAIVREVQAHSARIVDVRPPVSGAIADYAAMMQRAADVRGRALLYPYLSSGVGNGALIELADGSVKWDMICGIGVHFFGHSDADLVAAAVEAGIDDTVKQGNLQSNFEAYEFAETLLNEAKKQSRLKYCFPCTSGAMANENALKVCYQKHMPASRVLAFKDCFMGRSVTMAQIGDAAAYRVGVPLTVGVDYMPFWDQEAADRHGHTRYIDMVIEHAQMYVDRYPGQHACFIFELVQGEGGFNTAPREYFKALMEFCKANGIAVWDDEIQTFGRLPRMFAYEWLDLGEYVDVLCVGKLTHACATLYTEAYNPKPGLLSGTFTGETVSFRVGQRIIERLREGDFYGDDGRFARHHRAFSEQVRALAARHPDWFPKPAGAPDIVGGAGGMMRFTPFGGDKTLIPKACKHVFEEGAVIFYCGHGPYHLRMLPPLPVFDEADWPRVFQCIERGLAKTAAAM